MILKKTTAMALVPLLAAMLLAGCGPAEQAPVEQASAPAADDAIDLIVHGDYVVTMEEGEGVITDGAVAVDNGAIIAVGKAADITGSFTAIRSVPGNNRVVMPGLINGHQHAAMTLTRGIADDLALMEWLNDYIFPTEVEFVDAEFVRIGTELACWEMVRGGTTTFVDMYYFPDTIAEVVEDCGMRALISATVIDQRSPDAESAADSLDKAIAFAERWQNRSDRITPIFGPHSNYTLNADQLRATRDAANDAGVAISIHMSESMFESGYSTTTYGMTSVELFDSIGFFDGPTIAAHMVWPSEAEISTVVERQVGVIHNPSSNMKLASGIAPVAGMLEAGVRLGLGTDGAASNNDLDMWEEMRLAALLQKVDRMDPEVLPAAAVLRMATIGGAEAIGLADQIGSLASGKRADLIQVSLDDVHFIPTFNVLSHLVYVADEQDVVTVVVDGQLLLIDGQYPMLDTTRVRREATALGKRIQDAVAAGSRGN